MPTPTYDLLASTTTTSTVTSVTFSSLDTLAAGYRDLVFTITGQNSGTSPVSFRVNGLSTAIYSEVFAYGSGGSASSDVYPNLTRGYFARVLSLANASASIKMELFDFATVDKHKSFLARSNAPTGAVEMTAGRVATTNAITSIEFGNSGADSWTAGIKFDLYGIAG